MTVATSTKPSVDYITEMERAHATITNKQTPRTKVATSVPGAGISRNPTSSVLGADADPAESKDAIQITPDTQHGFVNGYPRRPHNDSMKCSTLSATAESEERSNTASKKDDNERARDRLQIISLISFLSCTTFWVGAASQLDDFWSTIQNALVALSVCFLAERVVISSWPSLKKPYVTLHFGLGLVQNILYVTTFLADPNIFAKIWTSAYFGYYIWTWTMLVTKVQEFFTLFRIFYTVHHTVSFFITGSWILVGQFCKCPMNLYLIRGIVLWLSSDIWVYLLNFTRSIYPGMDVQTIRKQQLIVFIIERLQRLAAYIQALVLTQGEMNTLDWVVLGTGFFNDILDASFQARSLSRSFHLTKQTKFEEQQQQKQPKYDDNDIESNQGGVMLDKKQDTSSLGVAQTTPCFPKPFLNAAPALNELLSLSEFDKTTQWELLPSAFQQLTQKRLELVAETGAFQMSQGPGMGPGGTTKPGGFQKLLEAFHWVGAYDMSLFDVVGVHAIGGNVVFIHGSESQLTKHRTSIDQIKDVYCFAATELAHGSNLKQVQTLAEYDAVTNEFVLQTPNSTACKYWIGNSTFVADYAVVLANLVVNREERGIGWLRVPLWNSKEKKHRFPGVIIRDVGAKAGCNGIGNGCLTFDQVRLPREALLSQFCQVDKDGEFRSALSSSELFLRCIQTFVLERIGVATAAIGSAKTAVSIALRYASARHQFGPQGGKEVPLISYPMHCRRLMTRVVRLFVGKAAVDRVGRAAEETFHPHKFTSSRKVLHAQSCLVKAFGSWEAFEAAQEARECCGGHGFAAVSQIGMIRNDIDVTLTFAGDNSLLALEAVRSRLKDVKGWSTTKKLFGPMRPNVLRNISWSDNQSPLTLMQKCLKLLLYREESMLLDVAKKIQANRDRGFRGFTEQSFVMREIASAIYDRLCVETWLEQQMDQGHLYCEIGMLDAIQRVQKHTSWYLIKNVLIKSTHRTIEVMINNLCEILGSKHALVEAALCVPDELVEKWPLVHSDYCQRLCDLTYPV